MDQLTALTDNIPEWVCKSAKVAERVIVVVVVTGGFRVLINNGPSGVGNWIWGGIRNIPGVEYVIKAGVAREAQGAARQLGLSKAGPRPQYKIPETGTPNDQLMAIIRGLKEQETKAESGKLFAYVYTQNDARYKVLVDAMKTFSEKQNVTDEDRAALQRQAYSLFQHTNALNPMAFPSLRKFETETVSMTASMLNGDAAVVGNLTSGGTESILVAVKAYRDLGRSMGITEPELIAPITAHPAFDKACSYFQVKMIHTEIGTDYKANVQAIEKAITKNTVLIVASAPQYCHGVIDPIEEIGEVAELHGVPVHVDACFGGFMLPWLEKLGEDIPPFDFRVDGVTSISADLHKYGWAIKGSSVVVFRNAYYRRFAIYAYSGWPGGLFASPSILGTRPGGIVAAAWAALKSVGEDGYLKLAKQSLTVTKKLKAAVREIPSIELCGESQMTSLAIKSVTGSKVDILAFADVMEAAGWTMERQQNPPSIHFSIMPHHEQSCDQLIADMKTAVDKCEKNEIPSDGSAAMYGMAANIPDKAVVNDFLTDLMNEIWQTS